MKGSFWNLRRLNKPGRMKCLYDFVKVNNLDLIGVQETKKELIPRSFLDGVDKNFAWKYVPAKGTTGGILLGCKNASLEIVSWQGFNFCGAALVRQHGDVEMWRVIVVYGSPYEETKVDCILELHQVMESGKGPTLLGGF
jgi:hypothetical protein